MMASASIHQQLAQQQQQQQPQATTDKVTLIDAISNVDVLDDVVLCVDVP